MKSLLCLILFFLMLPSLKVSSQGLERIIVEEYFVYDTTRMEKIEGLNHGSVTYRIYVDLEEDYMLRSIFGSPLHPLRFETSTTFYNHRYGVLMGDGLVTTMLNEVSYLLDSYITIAAASNAHLGILKDEDDDGSVIESKFFVDADGLKESGIPQIMYFNLEPDIFNTSTANIYNTENFLIGSHQGGKGPTPENRVLVAQLTTDGDLSFEFNVQVARPNERAIKYMAREPLGAEEKLFEDLIYGESK